MQADKIGFSAKLFQGRSLPFRGQAGCVNRGIVIEHPHGKARRAPGNGLANPAHPHDSQGLGKDVMPQHQHRFPAGEASGAQIVIAFHNAPGAAHDQSPGEIGSALGEHSGSVADRDAALGGKLHIDVIESHGVVGDAFKARPGGKHVAVDGVRQQAEQGVRVPDSLAELLFGQRLVLWVEPQLKNLSQPVQSRLGYPLGHKNQWFHNFILPDLIIVEPHVPNAGSPSSPGSHPAAPPPSGQPLVPRY